MSEVTIPAGPVKAETMPVARQTRALFLVSVLGLFLELMLIRWIGTEIRIFAYLQNTVLVVCFLGLGMGCWTCRQPVGLRQLLEPLFVLLLLLVPICWFALGTRITLMLNALGDILLFVSTVTTNPLQAIWYVGAGLCFTFILMLLLWDVFVPVGRLLGRLLDDHPRPIWAYSVNVAGSLLGIWLFVLLSALRQPPAVWTAVLAGLIVLTGYSLALVRKWEPLWALGLVGLAWLASREPGALEVTWSPYQKLALFQRAPGQDEIWDYVVSVNNSGGYQWMTDLREESIRKDPERYRHIISGLSHYDMPLVFHPHPRKLLIVGAGSGNGTAAAVRHHVPEIVSVDIDPVIIDLGKRYHPEKPYSSPAVRVVNDDARSYFATSTEKFDVISFEFLDSHTMTAMTNARLDHYVYTRESFQRAKDLLAEGGLLVLLFGYEKPFVADRMAISLREVFGQEPLFFSMPHEKPAEARSVFVAGDLATANQQLAKNKQLRELLPVWQATFPLELTGTTPEATDDWPYIYLEGPRIPVLYVLLALMLVLLFLRGMRRLHLREALAGFGRTQWHFFFLGAAFMLLEVQNVSKASVVLGNTWEVNAVIISCVLILILLANWIAAALPNLPVGPVYGLLCGTCLLLYFVDVARFGFLPFAGKAAVVGGLTSLPMLFSGIIFIRSFAVTPRKDVALGANLLGALVGGVLQSLTFVTGIKALLLIVAGLYFASLLTRPAAVRESSPKGVPEPSSLS